MNTFEGTIGGSAEWETLKEWRSDIGRAWMERNPHNYERVDNEVGLWRQIQGYIGDDITSALEIGAGTGAVIDAVWQVWPQITRFYAVEPNDAARRALGDKFDKLYTFGGSATQMTLGDACADLVYTSGVLIHVPPSDLIKAYQEIYRVAKTWIVCNEYFSADPEEKRWRGRDGLLFKRDFGQLWCDLFPTIQPVACGFSWKKITGLDNMTWWIFKK